MFTRADLGSSQLAPALDGLVSPVQQALDRCELLHGGLPARARRRCCRGTGPCAHVCCNNRLQVDYYLALDAHQFVGNSVAVADALLIMERWHAGRYATYYNGGNIPLEAHIPLFP